METDASRKCRVDSWMIVISSFILFLLSLLNAMILKGDADSWRSTYCTISAIQKDEFPRYILMTWNVSFKTAEQEINNSIYETHPDIGMFPQYDVHATYPCTYNGDIVAWGKYNPEGLVFFTYLTAILGSCFIIFLIPALVSKVRIKTSPFLYKDIP